MRAISRSVHRYALPAALALAAIPLHAEESVDLWTGKGVKVGRIFTPQLTLTTAVGASTAEEGALSIGHHDPDRDGFTLQNFEFALSAQFNSHLSATALYAAKVDLDDHWEDEFEEYYFSLENLPGDLRFKAGRFFTQFGFQNSLHPHEFEFVDQFLANGRLLGEDAATVFGGEVSLPLFTALPSGWSDRLTLSFGAVPDGHEEHHHGHEAEAGFEGHLAAFNDVLGTAEYRLTYEASDTVRYQFGISGAWAKNQFERQTNVYGLHFERLWKARAEACDHKTHAGHDHQGHSHASGEFFRWRSEAFVRHFGAVSGGAAHEEHELEEAHEEPGHAGEHEEHEEEEHGSLHRKSFTDAGFYTALSYGFPNGRWQAHLRGEYVSGIAEAGLDERWRISPAISWAPSDRLPVSFKLQYNYDHVRALGDEHSVWLQVKVRWGEERAHAH